VDALADGATWGLNIDWSHEDQPLETAGGLATARPLLGKEPFLVVNADVYCDYPFDSLAKLDLGDLDAHIVMVPNPPFRPLGDFSLEGNRVGNREASRYTYSGIGVFHPRMLDSIAAGTKAPLAPLLRAAADAGRLGGEVYAGPWSDVGTPERLAELNREPNEPKAS
jgi:MurNAc alpha-1-phosphate uridylyltransferase